jgi:hypothetical protein
LARREVTREHRLLDEFLRIIGPELAHLRVRFDDRVGEFAVDARHFPEVDVQNRGSVFVESYRADRPLGEADLVHGFEECRRVIRLSTGRLEGFLDDEKRGVGTGGVESGIVFVCRIDAGDKLLVVRSVETRRIPARGIKPSTTSSGAPTVTIDYKKFGVELSFVPTVLSRGQINLRIEPTVSEPDFTNTVVISGTVVPSLTVRTTRTTVELRDGQSFAIAGLLQTKNTRAISQVPWIGSVPVLGALFRSSDYQQQETDLVVIVTPHLVAPAVPGQRLASPLDQRLPSNDVDFFLNGQPDVRKRYTDFVTSGADLVGPYGHIIAPDGAPPPAGGGAIVKAKD